MIFILMDNGNGPPSLMQFLKSVDGKLKPSLEWPNDIILLPQHIHTILQVLGTTVNIQLLHLKQA